MSGRVINGDCIEAMQEMEEESVEAVVTDPPYGLAFMGNDWDDFDSKEYQEFCEEWGEQALRVLKPGGHLLAFSGTRTYHRMVVGLEDAGFEIRDQLAWMYGQGFPKSHDISKAIDDHLGQEREKVGEKKLWGHNAGKGRGSQYADDYEGTTGEKDTQPVTEPSSSEAKKWEGYGTALKPSHEPVVLAQKSREGTYAENVLRHGVGGLNIDACRIGVSDDDPQHREASRSSDSDSMFGVGDEAQSELSEGRWPGNVVLDERAAGLLDEQSGERKGRNPQKLKSNKEDDGWGSIQQKNGEIVGYDDKGGASRFFYSAKAHKSERNAGLDDVEDREYGAMKGHKDKSMKTGSGNERDNTAKNDISTLKPINLMRWLLRLVTPEDGTVLDPFAGSGTTGCAAEVEGRDYILIEKRDRFADLIAPKRCEYWSRPENWSNLKEHEEVPSAEEQRNNDLQKFMEAKQ